jgi:hypothetical protein
MLISFPLLIMTWHTIKTYNYHYYPMLAYVGMGIIVIGFFSTVSLDMRYQITFFPLILPIAACFFQRSTKAISLKLLYGSYIVCLTGLIVFYNHR